jgi:DNA-binding transcriptional regulator YbjK
MPGITAARRKHNAPQRRRELADAAIELLGTDGARGLSHPKVDVHAAVPAGTTSFYFRTRKALLEAVAVRLTELDVTDLTLMTELSNSAAAGFTGTAGLARMVMLSGEEPWLTRTKARYELALHSSRDPELARTLQQSSDGIFALARDVVAQWHTAEDTVDPELAEEQAAAMLTFINGVMFSFVTGRRVVGDADHLDRLIRAVITGVARTR